MKGGEEAEEEAKEEAEVAEEDEKEDSSPSLHLLLLGILHPPPSPSPPSTSFTLHSVPFSLSSSPSPHSRRKG